MGNIRIREDWVLQFPYFIIFISLLLSGCMVGPDFKNPHPPQTHSYTETELPEKTVETKGPGGEAQYFIKGKDIPSSWWYLFHSQSLNELIKRALKNNPNLKAAQAAFCQAEESLNVSRASLLPFVSLQSFAERQRFSGDIFGVTATKPRTFNLYNVSTNVSYTLDIFGGLRRQIETAEAQVDFQNFELEATYLTLTSNIVTTAILEASLRAQIQATQELISSQEKILKITEKKFDLGGASRLDILAQETQLAHTRANLPPLLTNLARTRHALSVLVGELPSESKLPFFALTELKLPRELPVTCPSLLVRQRPDVQAAEALLHAASAQIGVATANLLPQVTLTGSFAWDANKLKDLFHYDSTIWNIIGNLLQPVYDGGALLAKREIALAAFQQAYAQYQQTVLQAFQNVADVLKALELDAHQLHIQTLAEEAAAKTLALTESQYKLGAVSYLNLLAANTQYHQVRIGRIKAEAARYADTAALFQALGGGWWNRKVPLCDSRKKRIYDEGHK